MARPFGDRHLWTFGYYPSKVARRQLIIARKLYTGCYVAGVAAQRASAENGCEVTQPLRVTIEIPKGVWR